MAPSQPSVPLAGRVEIVTGSSCGIGRAITIHLDKLGARLVIDYSTKSADVERVEINDLPPREEITGKRPRAIVAQAEIRFKPGEIAIQIDKSIFRVLMFN
ncbi:unnamed protein product [Cochlearia groenlandica]